MNYESPWRLSGGSSGGRDGIPDAPPLPTPRPLQRARDAATRFFSYQSRSASPHGVGEEDKYFTRGRSRFASLSANQDATATHKTGLGINTIAINEKGTHALLGGKEIFRTVKVENGTFAVGFDLRGAIRSTPVSASGQARNKYTIDIADVAWARGDCGDYVAAATSSGKIILYDLGHAGIQAAQLHEHFRQVHTVTFNPHRGCLLLSGSQDGTVRLWDVRDVRSASTLHSKRKYSGQSDGVRDVKWSPTEGVDFAFGTDSGWIQRWDIRNLKTAIVRIAAHSETCNSIDWHPDGKHIVSASSDKTVRVWDFSAGKKHQKAKWEIQTPHRVSNARWRPSCETSIPGHEDARQCTQLVTTYDELHPTVHVWDLRRPMMPFRELFPHATAPTDLIWHSQDLLWTVGREGTFSQTDIQYASKTLDKRNMQAFATSTMGDVSFFAQSRPRQRVLPHLRAQSSLNSKASSRSQSPRRDDMLSRSWADDGLDHSFLRRISMKTDTQRPALLMRASSVLTSGSNEMMLTRTLDLDEVMSSQESLRPAQNGFYGLLPYSLDPRVFAFLARNYQNNITEIPDDEDFLSQFEKILDHNARVAETAGLYRTAQTWRLVKFVTLEHLKKRAELKQGQQNDRPLSRQKTERRGKLIEIMRRLTGETDKSPMSSAPSTKPLSAVQHRLARSEVTSNQATPLVQATRRVHTALTEDRELPEIDHEGTTALPPPIAPPPSNGAYGSAVQPKSNSQLTSSNLDGLQKLQHHTVEAHKQAMVRRCSIQSREPLTLDPVDANGIKIRSPKLQRHASNESFTFLDGSANSRDHSFPSSYESRGSPLDMVASRPSRTFATSTDTMDHGVESQDFDDRPALGPVSVEVDDQTNGQSGQHITFDDSVLRDDEHSSGLSSRPRRASGSVDGQTAALEPMANRSRASSKVKPARSNPALKKTEYAIRSKSRTDRSSFSTLGETSLPTLYLPSENDEDIESAKPFRLIELLREFTAYYAGQGDAQTSTQLLLILMPLLPRTQPIPESETVQTVASYVDCFNAAGYTTEDIESILSDHMEGLISSGVQPLQVEAVLTSYHDQLVSRRLFNEAALLRRMAYPLYPSVYEDALTNNHVHLKCGNCRKAIQTSLVTLRCENCHSKQGHCVFCLCENSPYEEEHKAGKHSKLMTTCLRCNHSSHAACLRTWYAEGDGGCPTEGCLCDCVAGTWREEKSVVFDSVRKPKGHGRVKSDELFAKESGAVNRARAVLKGP